MEKASWVRAAVGIAFGLTATSWSAAARADEVTVTLLGHTATFISWPEQAGVAPMLPPPDPCPPCGGRFTIIDPPPDLAFAPIQDWLITTRPTLDKPIFTPQGDPVPDSPNIPNLVFTYVGQT